MAKHRKSPGAQRPNTLSADKKYNLSHSDRGFAKTLHKMKNDYNLNSYNVLPNTDLNGESLRMKSVNDVEYKAKHRLYETRPKDKKNLVNFGSLQYRKFIG